MATTTPLNGWPVPTSTDYVKDGAADIEALGDAIDASVGEGLLAWTAYTPTFTNLTVGSATLDFAYCQIGKTVHVRGLLTFGSGTTVTGNMSLSLPVTAISGTANPTLGNARYVDTGTGSFAGFYTLDTGAVSLAISNVAGTYPTVVGVGTTVPFTWAINDRFSIYATYQAA